MIETLSDLVLAVRSEITGGYDVEFEIQPQLEEHRYGDYFFTVIRVTTNRPWSELDDSLNGDWWFDATDRVMQVL